MIYSPKAVKDWFSRTLGINATPSKGEIQTSCPECGSNTTFYFNIFKQVGICHKASCDYRPTLEVLIERVGFAPEEHGYYTPSDKEEPEKEIKMPGYPVVKMLMSELKTTNQRALDYLRSRGITDEITLNWEITTDGERVYVPIKSEGVVRNYNSRLLPFCDGPKYLYAPGAKTSSYILGNEECQLWPRLALVENTFVSLWLRNSIYCSTNFGSHLSTEQGNLIARSNIGEVALLWDSGAELKAEKAVKKLHSMGVRAAFWLIRGQPDDHRVEWVIEKTNAVFEAARNGVDYVDFRDEYDDR